MSKVNAHFADEKQSLFLDLNQQEAV